MIIQQRSPLVNGPSVKLIPKAVIEEPGVILPIEKLGIHYIEYNTATFYYDYLVTGPNTENLTVYSSNHEVDESEYPLIKKTEDSAETATYLKLTDGIFITSSIFFDFSTKFSQKTHSNPKSFTPGSYAEYSWNRVHEIFSQLPPGGHALYDPITEIRKYPTIIPHWSLVCQMFHHVVAYNDDHLLWAAITPRHIIGIAHNGGANEDTIGIGGNNFISEWKTEDNQVVHVKQLTSLSGSARWPGHIMEDVRIILLEHDLPPSIEPCQVMGDWFYHMNFVPEPFTGNDNGFGIMSFGRSRQIVPIQCAHALDLEFPSYAFPPLTFNGTTLTKEQYFTAQYFNPITVEGFEHWSYLSPSNPFYHSVIPGDSGSPAFFPVKNGKWAIAEMSGHLPRWEMLNQMIEWVDEIAISKGLLGAPTGYTVTVAENPLL